MRVMSSLHRIIALKNILVITIVALSLSSCYNEPQFIGGNLLSSDELAALKIDTTFEVSAFTVKPDTLQTQGFSNGVIGCLNSKIFGKTKADFLTQVYLSTVRTTKPLFGTEPYADSLVIYFKLKSHYGDKSQPLTMNLYELKDTLSSFRTYDGFVKDISSWYNPTKIISKSYFGDSLLRIKFFGDDALPLKLLAADKDSATVSSDKNFKSYFKGFYLTCDDVTGNGVMYNFDFTTTETVMRLYYHNADTTAQLAFNYTIGSSYYVTPRFNHISHDYTTADPTYKIKHLNDLVQDSVFYVEGLGGARGLINFDGVTEWAKKMPIAINRAELRIEPENYPLAISKDSTIDHLFYFVEEISTGFTEDQKILNDQNMPTYVKYNKAKKYYSFNLTVHLQSILTGKVTSKSMYILPLNTSISPYRTVLRSGSNSKRMKLIITYTKL